MTTEVRSPVQRERRDIGQIGRAQTQCATKRLERTEIPQLRIRELNHNQGKT